MAVELAGPNHHDAQETWQRVFRDAERAVLRSTPAAFEELAFLPDQVRELVLWHRQGSLGLARLPGPLARMLGDQDGLFAAACTQYRESMNAVAAWCKERALMDYTGDECIPLEASLLETRIARPTQVARLQRRDGYAERLDVLVDLPEARERSLAEVEGLLAAVPSFALLTREELQTLARTARPLTLGPLERIVVQGQPGTSLFVVVDGDVESCCASTTEASGPSTRWGAVRSSARCRCSPASRVPRPSARSRARPCSRSGAASTTRCCARGPRSSTSSPPWSRRGCATGRRA